MRVKKGDNGVPTRARALLAAWVALVAAPAQAAELSGRVRLDGAAPATRKVAVGVDNAICGTEKDREALLVDAKGGVMNAVVELIELPTSVKVTTGPAQAVVDQKACRFLPHIALVGKGGTVTFSNSDPLLHNVRVASLTESMNKVATLAGSVSKTFNTPGMHVLKCDFHSWMSAYVYVVESQFAALTDSTGAFTFKGLPAGSYRVRVWHEKLGVLTGHLTTGKKGELTYPPEAVKRPEARTQGPSEW
jgi:plastocyanin